MYAMYRLITSPSYFCCWSTDNDQRFGGRSYAEEACVIALEIEIYRQDLRHPVVTNETYMGFQIF